MTNAIDITHLSRHHRDATALDDVTVSFEAGVIHGLLGRNGAGKTSLMSIASGQDWPSTGDVRAFGLRPYLMVVAVLAGALAYLVLRRDTPAN